MSHDHNKMTNAASDNAAFNRPGFGSAQLGRRDALKMLLAISAVGATACVGATGDSNTASVKPAAKTLSASQLTLLTALADTIIPTTDTPGALDAGVPATLAALYADWGNAEFRTYWSTGLDALGKTLVAMGGQDFARMNANQREALLGRYDADVFEGKVDDPFYKDMKATTATAYYMSEPGATEELIYEAVPGEWKGCVPFSDIGRTWAT